LIAGWQTLRQVRFGIADYSSLRRARYWELVADKLSKAGWSWGCVSAIDPSGQTISIADAHRNDGKRFIVRADEKLTAFMELERAICLRLLSEQI